MSFRFAHIADIHIGSWNEPQLRNLSVEALRVAVDKIISEKVDFVIFAGDIFNTALPAIDHIKSAVLEFVRLKKAKIPAYYVAGSHDFSPNGKTMLDIIQSVGLIINVVKGRVSDSLLRLDFVKDEKTGAKICGMIGKKGMLDKNFYDHLDLKSLESEKGHKIFVFHTSISEMMPVDFAGIDSIPISSLPRGFDYYAGGHIHEVVEFSSDGYRKAVYPGPLFPANFREFEKLGTGGMFFVEIGDDVKTRYEKIDVCGSVSFKIDCDNKSPNEIYSYVNSLVSSNDVSGKIVLLRFLGTVKQGFLSADIDFNKIFSMFYDRSAYYVLRNTAKLSSHEFEEIKTEADKNPAELEKEFLNSNIEQLNLPDVSKDDVRVLVSSLISCLDTEILEGETKAVFEKRIVEGFDSAVKDSLKDFY